MKPERAEAADRELIFTAFIFGTRNLMQEKRKKVVWLKQNANIKTTGKKCD